MVHQEFQEAIAQLSSENGMDSEQVRNQFNLNSDDMSAIQSYESQAQSVAPRDPGLCSCCCCV